MGEELEAERGAGAVVVEDALAGKQERVRGHEDRVLPQGLQRAASGTADVLPRGVGVCYFLEKLRLHALSNTRAVLVL